ncbi:MAG TPA: aminotransferase class III-fold pyridoxal phosphate-dependent enzyme [Gemmatimonadaceae bacterium]|nr:aminotransferase class III-fold pyridoxal phosphate-dependent enzyme [Gemmatimonadaceae bacterium]
MALPSPSSSAVDTDWRARAAAVIPGGASTGSKRPDALVGPDWDGSPTHYVRATGCRVVTAAGAELIDCTMALGAVALGYAHDGVTQAVTEAVARGNVAGLPHVLEVEVAERLCEVIPCAEQVRFLKSGAEGVAAAVRIARAATGRSMVIGAGYFGWLDWWSSAAGVPAGAHEDFRAVPFDDVDALADAARAAGDRLAAIIIEPVIERLPAPEWLAEARRLCDALGAVFILDEMKTGFRMRTGGFQEYAHVDADLAVFGKALANGFPLAAVVGRERVMRAARATWISSTLAGESAALAAARAVLDAHAQSDVCATLWERGEAMRHAVTRAIESSGVADVRVRGIAPMWLLDFGDDRRLSRFVALALGERVLFKRGAYNFASVAHDATAIARLETAARHALVALGSEDSRG